MGNSNITVPVNCSPIVVPTSTALIGCAPGAVLGTGSDLRVLLLQRGATAVLAELSPIDGSFTRMVDGSSEFQARFVVSGVSGEACCEGLEQVAPWATEIVVYRDGRDAFCGPVTHVDFQFGSVQIFANDMTAWWSKRKITKNLSFVNVDLTDIFVALHTNAMSSDPSPNFVLTPTLSGILGNREYRVADNKYVVDLLSELAKTGVDFSAYGRTVFVGGEEIPTTPYLTLLDEHWTTPPKVAARGDQQATQVIVRGQGVSSTATADAAYLAYYGLLERSFDENTIIDQATCDRAAQTRLALLQDPLYIETPANASLKTTAPITLPELIPGMRIRVDTQSTCRKLVSDFRLQQVKVNLNGNVEIGLQPLGTINSDSLIGTS